MVSLTSETWSRGPCAGCRSCETGLIYGEIAFDVHTRWLLVRRVQAQFVVSLNCLQSPSITVEISIPFSLKTISVIFSGVARNFKSGVP